MFTGIILETGRIERAETVNAGRQLVVRCEHAAASLDVGGSVAVDGVCLTATRVGPDGFDADVSAETLERSTLGSLGRGDAVNLELPLALGAPVGGHLVQGHVDGVGVVAALDPRGDGCILRVTYPRALGRYVVEKGSVAVAGVSLTVTSITDEDFAAAIIPHTYRHTTMAGWRRGQRVNVEADVISKYVEKLLSGSQGGGLTGEKLAALGFGIPDEDGL